MIRKALVAAMTLGAFIVSFNCLWSQQQSLRHDVTQEACSETGTERIRLSFKHKAPEGIDMPAFNGSKVCFARWKTPRVEAGHLWLALDRSMGAPCLDLLYFDTNCNQSLEDETPLKAVEVSDAWFHFEPVRILFHEDPYVLRISFFRYPGLEGFYTSAASRHEGTVNLGGDTVFCRLIDANCNGTFNDIDEKMESTDRMELGEKENPKRYLTGKYLLKNSTYYRIEAALDGSTVSFIHEQELPLATLSVPEEVKEVNLYGAGGHLILEQMEGEVPVPAALGKNRSMEHPITLVAGTGIHVAVGQPLRAELEIKPRRGGIYTINEKLKSGWGDDVEIEVNGQAPPPPRLLIKNEKETYGELFDFTYG
jgi:hypothetical protein